MALMKCSRCGGEPENLKTISCVRPGDHSLPSISQPDYKAIAPTVDRVCDECVTDDELVLELGPVVAFVAGVMLKRIAKEPQSQMRDEWGKVWEMARTPFIVRNNNPDENNRRAALRAVGL